MINRKYGNGKTSEEICQEGLHVGIYPVRKIREYSSKDTKGICVIWCVNISFRNLVTGVVGLRVTEI